ncbi:hypothetical protein [Streptomyces sp. NPDC087862]|uniref:hypothetical protein n=1 Tax=Streptomyces sp. NPDC087862 TaxID=3365813 RepID=UPI0037F69DAE
MNIVIPHSVDDVQGACGTFVAGPARLHGSTHLGRPDLAVAISRERTVRAVVTTHRVRRGEMPQVRSRCIRRTSLTTGNAGDGHPEPLVLFSMSPRETGADHLVRVAEWQTR